MFLNHFLTLLAFVVFIQLLVYTLYLDWRSLANRLIAVIFTLLAFSTGCDYYYLVTHDARFITKIFKVTSSCWEILVPLFLHFFATLFETKKKPAFFILIYALVIPSVIHINYEQNLLITNANDLWGWRLISDKDSILFWYSNLLGFVYIGIFIGLLFSPSVKTNYRIQKQASIIRNAFFITAMAMYLPWTIAKLLNYTNYPVYQNIGAMMLGIAVVYGMSRYRLQSLRTSRMLTDLIEKFSGFIIIISPEGNILSVNRQSIPYSGYAKQELEGKSIDSLIEDYSLLTSEIKKINERITYAPHIELGIKSKSGETLIVKTGINAIRNQFDEVLGYYLIFYGLSTEMQRLDKLQHQFDLTNREKDVALLLTKGMSNQEIADKLFISLATVKTHSHNIYQKTNTKNKAELRNILPVN